MYRSTQLNKIVLWEKPVLKVLRQTKRKLKMPRKFVGPNTCTACRPAGSNGAGARAQVEAAGRGVGEADPGLGEARRRAPGVT